MFAVEKTAYFCTGMIATLNSLGRLKKRRPRRREVVHTVWAERVEAQAISYWPTCPGTLPM